MRYSTILFIMSLLVFFPAFAWGDDFSILPSISVQEAYNSNIFLTATNIRRDFITTLSPGVEMVDRTGRLDTDLSVHLDQLEYASSKGLNATNQTYKGSLRYLVSPLFGVSAAAGYSRNSNPTLGTTVSTSIVTTAVPWNHISYSLSSDYQFTEKTAGTVSYSYGRDYYESSQYLSDTTQNVNAGLVYDLGKYLPTVKGRMNVGYSYYYYPDNKLDSVMGTVGFSKNFDEVWSAQVDAGLRNTWSSVIIPIEIIGYGLINVPIKNEGWGWVGDASLNYNGEVGSGSLTYNRSLTPAYGLNGAAEQNALTAATQYQFSYELSALFSASYYTLKSFASQFSTQAINQETFTINPRLRYEFSKDMALESSYEYDKIRNSVSNTNESRQLFSVRFYMQHPFLKN